MAVRRNLRRGTLLMLAGATLTCSGTAVLLWPSPRVVAEIGSVSAPPAERGPAAPSAPPSRPAPPASPGVPAPTGFEPQRLRVASLGIDAALTPTAVDADGALVPPDDPAQLAWWLGVRPGTGAGSVLVAGHLDMYGYGQGPLARIVHLRPGDRAVLVGPAGSSATYVLRGVTTLAKQTLPAAELFGTGGPERLVLVTCGGTYDPGRRSWDSNVVAIFDPVSAG